MKLIKICTISAGLLLSFGGLLNSSILSIKNDRDVILSENIEAMSQDGENPRKFEAVICYNDSASMGTVSILCPKTIRNVDFQYCPTNQTKVAINGTHGRCLRQL